MQNPRVMNAKWFTKMSHGDAIYSINIVTFTPKYLLKDSV